MSKNDEYITLNLQPFLMPGAIVLSSLILSLGIYLGLNKISLNVSGTTNTTGTVTNTTQTGTGEETIETAATKIGLSAETITSCVTALTTDAIVKQHMTDGDAAGISGTPGFIIGKVNGDQVEGLRIKGAFPFSTFQEILDAYLSNDQAKITEIGSREDTSTPGTKLFPASTTSISNAGKLGDTSKNVAIVEYTDLDCFFCQRNHKEVFPTVKSDYIDSGKIFYVTKHYPIVSLHPDAENKALAAECVRASNGDAKYYEYVDLFLKR